MTIEEMFLRQKDVFTPEQQEKISQQQVVIVGIGALGQIAAETCVRSGFHHLTLIDGDFFTYSNFNRQLYAVVDTIGRSKAEVTRQALLQINPDLDIRSYEQFFGPKSDAHIIPEDCIILDCTDDIQAKIYLEEFAQKRRNPLIHGAIDGWYGQVAAIFPGDRILREIYRERDEKTPSALMVTANVVASLQVRALMRILCGEKEQLRKKITFVDINQCEIDTVSLSDVIE